MPHEPASAGNRITTSGSMLYEGGVEYFQSQFCKPLLQASFAPTTDTPFRVAARLGIIDDHRSIRLHCTPGIFRRRNGPAAAASPHCLVIAPGNSCGLLIRDQSLRLKPGTAAILDGSCEFDLILEKDAGETCLVDWLHFAASAPSLFPDFEAVAVISSEAVTAYISFYNDVMTNGRESNLAPISRLPSFNHLAEIIRSHLIRAIPPKNDGQFHAEIKAYINDNLQEADLSPESIAEHFDISLRKLYSVFEGMELSLRGTIIALRLEAARRDLELGTKNVTSVFLDYGFSNASTFYRLYKKHFGHPPRSGHARTPRGGNRPQRPSAGSQSE